MNFLALTPEQFSAGASAWLKAFTDIIVPLGVLAGAIFGFLAFLKAKANELRMDRQGDRIDKVMLQTPPAITVLPAPIPSREPMNVTVTNTPDNPVPTTEEKS